MNKTIYQNMSQDDLNEELINACILGNLDIVKYLLTSPELTENANIHYESDFSWNALRYAGEHGNLDIIKYLLTSPDLKEHANIHSKDKYGMNILIHSCSNGYLDIVQYLLTNSDLNAHADINDKDNSGWTALKFACSHNHLDVIEFLLIDMNMKVDNDTLEWLEGKSDKKRIYNHVLRLIAKRDLYEKLDNIINCDNIKSNKIKVKL